NNAKNNIGINKTYSDKLNTQVATGQKITRPSDDPVIAIRALRLNSNIAELNQYYDKNIPDADAWLTTTETALDQTNTILESIQSQLTTGASDDNTADDRMNLLENLSSLRDQIYNAGNADYAGRTVFTGYRTGESLTFMEDTGNLRYQMTEELTFEDVSKINYVSGDFEVNKSSLTSVTEQNISNTEVYRIRLAYNNLSDPQKDASGADLSPNISYTLKDGTTGSYTVDVVSFTGNQTADDKYYTDIGDDEVKLIADTGELILGANVAKTLQADGTTMSIEYGKSEFEKGDLRPEHYFACKSMDTDDSAANVISYNYDDSGDPDFQRQKITYEVAFNQSLEINTNACDVFTHNIGRDVDELVELTQAVIDIESKIDTLKEMQGDTSYSDTEQETIASMLEAATKEFDYLKENMQNRFSEAITAFQGYAFQLNTENASAGSKSERLELTRERVSEQRQNFKELADTNINIDLTDAAIDLKSAEVALQASQAATAKIVQQSLLNYL
ncbi:MAG: flagellar hook-associated protein FlgL, partial [Lachnospiraceae bacterium]|nr:flagellar hook-associated protein FlgL [Lachnospiraceae bacterium]